MHAKSEPWCAVRNVEDMKALLCEIEERRGVIRIHALRQSGNWGQVFYEAEMMRVQIRCLHDSLTECWERLYQMAVYNGLPRGDHV